MNTIFKRTFIVLLCTLLTFTNAQADAGDYNKETMGEIVVHCETASWGQNAPFNSQCWTSYGGSIQAKTGCVPTAHAIVMHYHKWPEVGTSSTLYNCQAQTYVEITDRTYDWDKMPLVYDSNASEEQKNAVAKLVSHLGHAYTVNHKTGDGNEGASTENLYKYFNYNNVSGNKINQQGIDTVCLGQEVLRRQQVYVSLNSPCATFPICRV